MSGIAQRINKKTTLRRQTGLGVVGAAVGQVIRRTSSVFKASRNMNTSKEIVSHHQSTGASYGLKKTDGTIGGELSAGTYQIIIESMLEAVFAPVTPYAAGLDVTCAVSAPQFVDAAGTGYLASGLKIGDVVRWTGFTGGAAANNAKNFWITALTATSMSGIFLNGDPVVAQAAGDSVTVTVVGKKCKTPMTGHTNDYLQVEEWYSDISSSDLFTDLVTASVDYDLPASGMGNFNASFIGLGRTLSSSRVMASATAETTTSILNTINGRVFVNGVSTPISSLKISLKNSAAEAGAEIGSNVSADVSKGVIEVTGTFSSMLRDGVLSALYNAETVISLACVATADQTATSDFIGITLGAIKITGDTPDDGTTVMRTYPFTAQLNALGGAALAWDQTIMTVQDSAAV